MQHVVSTHLPSGCHICASQAACKCPKSSVQCPASIMRDGDARRYKHISFRESSKGQKGWVVQYKGKTWGGFHQTQDDAAHTLRRVMGVASIKQLPGIVAHKPQQLEGRTSKYHGVYFHKHSGKWGAIRMQLGKLFPTEDEAATAVRDAAALGKEHKRPRPSSSAEGNLKSSKAPRTILRRVRFLSRVYHKHKKLLLPADVKACLARWLRFSSMFQEEHTTEVLTLQHKYAPWMHAMRESWTTRPKSKSSASSVQERASTLHQVLLRTAEKIQQKPVPRKWIDHAGRSVCRHSGGCQVLRGLGIISKSGGHGSAPLYEHHVGDQSAGYKILRSARSMYTR